MLVLNTHVYALPQATEVWVNRQGIHYQGSFSKAANQALFQAYQAASPKPQVLWITSGGGDINLAMDVGDFVLEHQLDVRVKTLCFSSCANYVLTSAKKAVVDHRACVGFHGSVLESQLDRLALERLPSLSSAQKDSLSQKFSSYLLQAKRRETRFFRARKVDHKITWLGHTPDYRAKTNRAGVLGWFYSAKMLEAMGFQALAYEGKEPEPTCAEGRIVMLYPMP